MRPVRYPIDDAAGDADRSRVFDSNLKHHNLSLIGLDTLNTILSWSVVPTANYSSNCSSSGASAATVYSLKYIHVYGWSVCPSSVGKAPRGGMGAPNGVCTSSSMSAHFVTRNRTL
jgi:hypothetical protein